MDNSNLVGVDTHEHGWCHPERQRLATHGAAVLSDRELLTLLLDTGAISGNPHDLAGRLLARFRSMRAVGRAHPSELATTRGLNAAVAAQLVAAFELARRAGTEQPPKRIVTAEDLVHAVTPLLTGQTRERLVVAICNRARRLIGCEVLAVGAADRSLMPVREVLVAVLRRDGQKFALAHNHPSGDPIPSRDDVEATRRMQRAAGIAGLTLLGHVVVTDHSWQMVGDNPPRSPTAALALRP